MPRETGSVCHKNKVIFKRADFAQMLFDFGNVLMLRKVYRRKTNSSAAGDACSPPLSRPNPTNLFSRQR